VLAEEEELGPASSGDAEENTEGSGTVRRDRDGRRAASRHGVLEEDLRRCGTEGDDGKGERYNDSGDEDAHAGMVRLA
jgi:hypothetical protein